MSPSVIRSHKETITTHSEQTVTDDLPSDLRPETVTDDLSSDLRPEIVTDDLPSHLRAQTVTALLLSDNLVAPEIHRVKVSWLEILVKYRQK